MVYSKSIVVNREISWLSKLLTFFQCDDIDVDDSDAYPLSGILPTPMALRDISNKAQMSLASLYQMSPGGNFDDDHQNSVIQKKLFDDDDVSGEEND